MFAQTGVARAFARFALKAVLDSGAPGDAKKERDVLKGIEEAADGHMLELACLVTFAKRIEARGDSMLQLSTFRIYSGEGEIDIVVYDRRDAALCLYEVKRSDEAKSDHGKNLINAELIEYLSPCVRRRFFVIPAAGASPRPTCIYAFCLSLINITIISAASDRPLKFRQ